MYTNLMLHTCYLNAYCIFLYPGLVGLALSYALSVTSMLNGVVTSFTETEKEMVSVERATHYIDHVPSETEDFLLYVSWQNRKSIQLY